MGLIGLAGPEWAYENGEILLAKHQMGEDGLC
jgi:hypothetical protein